MTEKDTQTEIEAERPSKHANIPADLMAKFVNREISSAKLAELTGYHPVYLRRSITRKAREEPKPASKLKLVMARNEHRAKLSHLPLEELAKQAHVSISTARRIKKANNA